MVVQAGQRLIPTGNQPKVHADPLGQDAGATTLPTDPLTGRAGGYVNAHRFDYVVTGSGLTARLYVDAAAGAPLVAQPSGFAPPVPLPDWWALDQCRVAAVPVQRLTFPGMTACTDPYQGLGIENPVGVTRTGLGEVLFLTFTGFRPIGQATAITKGVEYYAARLLIPNTQTAGPQACAGCGTELSIVMRFFSVELDGPPSGFDLVDPANPPTVTWQHGVVPVRNRTWGQIKSLYR